MTEKENTATVPRSWWQELFEYIRTAKPDARYTADVPAPIQSHRRQSKSQKVSALYPQIFCMPTPNTCNAAALSVAHTISTGVRWRSIGLTGMHFGLP